MTYPVFKKFSSTPFPGTMADTSTPTPAGQVPEGAEVPFTFPPREVQQYPSPIGPEDEGRFQAPDEVTPLTITPEEQNRLDELKDLRLQIRSEINWWRHAKYVEKRHWNRLLNRAQRNDFEPLAAQVVKQKALTDLRRQDATYAEEERLLGTPSGQESLATKEYEDRLRRKDEIFQLENLRRHMGLEPEDPSRLLQFYETGQAIRYPATEKDGSTPGNPDPVYDQRVVDLGKDLGKKGVEASDYSPRSKEMMLYGLEQEKLDRMEKDLQAAKERERTGVGPILGFATVKDLVQQLDKDAKDYLDDPGLKNEDGTYEREPLHSQETFTTQNAYGLDVQKTRTVSSMEQRRMARELAVSRWKGWEKYVPDYVDKGYQPPVDPNQKDVTPRPAEKK